MSFTHPSPQPKQERKQFRSDLQQALRAYLPSTGVPYKRVFVLLVCWSDASTTDDTEMASLQAVFRDMYNFETEKFQIPVIKGGSGNRDALAALTTKLVETVNLLDSTSLLIFYYAGHAVHEFDKTRVSATERSCYIQSERWITGNRFAATREESFVTQVAQIDLSSLLKMIEPMAKPDLLHILDCCYASSLCIMGRSELLAASAIDRPTPGSNTPNSFTRVLIETLAKASGRPFTVAQLHVEMLRGYYKNELITPPVHVELSSEMVTKGSIILTPLRHGSTAVAPPHQQRAQPFGPAEVDLKVLLSVKLSDVNQPPNATEWKAWLSSHLPPGIEEIQIEPVGFFKSSSSVLLITMPVEVWNVLRGHPAYMFIEVIRSRNLIPGGDYLGGGGTSLAIRTKGKENRPLGGNISGPSKGAPGPGPGAGPGPSGGWQGLR